MMITSLDQLDPNGTYTYADYLLWQFSERVELLRGKVRQMSAPSRKHQGIVTGLTRLFANALWKNACKVYVAPFDVRLLRTSEDKEVITVVQPDLWWRSRGSRLCSAKYRISCPATARR